MILDAFFFTGGDHHRSHNTDITLIPDIFFQAAKSLEVHFAHTSHGSQILSGAAWLELQNPKYNIAVLERGLVGLPTVTTPLRVYDGSNIAGNTYITPDLYWDGDVGKNYTRSTVNTGLFNYSMWAWCGQQSSNDVASVRRYLDTMDQFERAYPSMRFIYLTGHTDGTGSSGTLFRNNNLIRQYARDHGKALFDFADIETYALREEVPTITMVTGLASGVKPIVTPTPDTARALRPRVLIPILQRRQGYFASSKARHSGGC